MPTVFNGQTLIAPQVVSALDDSALNASGITASSVVAVVGPSTGGKPNTALAFTSVTDAITTLRSGALLDVCRRVFDPGAGNTGAAKVIAVRVTNVTTTPAARSTVTLQDGVAVNAVILTSIDYGVWNNQIRTKVETGTTQGKKLTTSAPVGGIVQNVVNDNVYRALFSVQYTGAASSSAMTISSTTLTTVNNGGIDQVTFTFATTHPTIQSIVDAFNATGKYSAAVLGLGTEAATTLDGQTSIDIKSGVFTATATLQAVIDAYNAGPFVAAARTTSLIAPANVGFTYLTGGTDGNTLVNADWTTSLAVLEPETVGIVCAATDVAAIHAAVSGHVTAMSAAKRERIAILGGAAAETVAATVTRATNIGSDRVGLVYPGLQDADPTTGVLTTYAPYVTAGAVAGLLSGGKIQQAATFRYIGAQAMEVRLKDSEVDTLLLAGVVPVQNVTGKGNRVVQSVTTNTSVKNYVHNELSVRRAADAVLSTVRTNCEPIVATTTGPELVGLTFSNVESSLNTLFDQKILVGTKGSSTPPYKNITVGVTGNAVTITFQAQVGVPANYILITAHLSPFSS